MIDGNTYCSASRAPCLLSCGTLQVNLTSYRSSSYCRPECHGLYRVQVDTKACRFVRNSSDPYNFLCKVFCTAKSNRALKLTALGGPLEVLGNGLQDVQSFPERILQAHIARDYSH